MFYLIQIEEIFDVHYTERFFFFKTQSSKELVKYVEISFPRMLKNENKENNQRKFLQFYIVIISIVSVTFHTLNIRYWNLILTVIQ